VFGGFVRVTVEEMRRIPYFESMSGFFRLAKPPSSWAVSARFEPRWNSKNAYEEDSGGLG
jgi:hypothetical protein